MNQKKVEQTVLAILLVAYILFGTRTPLLLVKLVNSGVGVVILIAFCWYLQKYSGTPLALLGGVASLVLLYRAWYYNYPQPSQATKDAQFAAFNHFPYTLEQEIIKEMLPSSQFYDRPQTFGYSFRPKIDNNHHAAPI
jgi:hypothetical protein